MPRSGTAAGPAAPRTRRAGRASPPPAGGPSPNTDRRRRHRGTGDRSSSISWPRPRAAAARLPPGRPARPGGGSARRSVAGSRPRSASSRGGLGVGPEALDGRAHAGHDAGRPARPTRRTPARARTRRAATTPVLPLPASWSSPASRTSSSVTPSLAQRRDDVEAVPPIGDVHRIEQCQLRRAQPGRQRRPLVGGHAGPHVRPELADLASPPGGSEDGIDERDTGRGRRRVSPPNAGKKNRAMRIRKPYCSRIGRSCHAVSRRQEAKQDLPAVERRDRERG